MTNRKSAHNPNRRKARDGGYYAIKGFLYQFDKTLIELMNNPCSMVCIENRQDIETEDYVLQVKHRETQTYSPIKIREPIEKLMDSFSEDPTRKYRLYCYFKNRTPHEWQLTMQELDSIISTRMKSRHIRPLREQFIACFAVCFSEDYETQFEQTIALIKAAFSISSDEEAILYHSIFRSKLLDRSIRLDPNERTICFSDLRRFLEEAEITIFSAGYVKYLEAEKYCKLIKKRYFTFSAPNINNFERVFLIEYDSSAHDNDLIEIVNRLGKKFCRRGKSPQPYVIFRNLDDSRLKIIKQSLVDSGQYFFDGTHFDGDRFRLDDLVQDSVSDGAFTVKIVAESQAQNILQQANIREVFQFFLYSPIDFASSAKHYRIQINNTEQVKQMIS